MSEEEPSPLISSVNDLSDFEKGQIVGAYLGGFSVKEVSQLCHVTGKTVAEVLGLYKMYLNVTPPPLKKNSGGRAAVLNSRRKKLKLSEDHNGEAETTSVIQTNKMADGGEKSGEKTASQVDLPIDKSESSNSKEAKETTADDGKEK